MRAKMLEVAPVELKTARTYLVGVIMGNANIVVELPAGLNW